MTDHQAKLMFFRPHWADCHESVRRQLLPRSYRSADRWLRIIKLVKWQKHLKKWVTGMAIDHTMRIAEVEIRHLD